MTAVVSEGTPLRPHRLRQRLRAAVLGPRGGSTTRLRASDAFRLGFAIVVAALLTWGICAVLSTVLGSAADRPPIGALAGLNTHYPVTQLA